MKHAKLLRAFVSLLVACSIMMSNTVVWADPLEDETTVSNDIDRPSLLQYDNEPSGSDDSDDSELPPDQVDIYNFDTLVADAEAEKEYRNSVEYEENKVVFSVIQYRKIGEQAVFLSETDDVCSTFSLKNVAFILESKTEKVESKDGYVAYQMFYEATVKVEDIWQLVDEMRENETIFTAEPEYIWEKTDEPDMTEVSPETLEKEVEAAGWCFQDLDCVNVWNSLTQECAPGEGVIVAVIDTGVDYNHLDLKTNMWVNPNEIPDNGIDDDGNGYIDDIHGINLIDPKKQGDPMDDMGHGTHVAGIIAMTPRNGGGVGIAYGAKIMAVKAGQANGKFSSVDIAKGIMYASANGADVINMSFGGDLPSALVEVALEDAFGSCVLVASAGNNGLPTKDGNGIDIYPASYSYVLGVMAYDSNGELASFSNWDYRKFANAEYEICAPGVSIFSTLPGNKYATWSGTSMAAPVVSAVAAIFRREYPDKFTYSSRYIMSQLAFATNDKVIYNRRVFSKLNIWDSFNSSPVPVSCVDEIIPFDYDDGIIQSGEMIDLGFVIKNFSGVASDIVVRVDSKSEAGIDNPYIQLLTDQIVFDDDVGTYSKIDNGFIYDDSKLIGVENPIKLKISDDAPNGLLVTLNFNITAKNGWDKTDPTIYEVGDFKYTFEVQNGKYLRGTISQDLVLTPDYLWIIDGSLVIPDGVMVNVEAGTNIQFYSVENGPYADKHLTQIVVRGQLHFDGTLANPIDIYPSKIINSGIVDIHQEGNGIVDMSYVRIANPYLLIHHADHVEFIQYTEKWHNYSSDGKEQPYNIKISADEIIDSIFRLRLKSIFTEGCLYCSHIERCLFDNTQINISDNKSSPPSSYDVDFNDSVFLLSSESIFVDYYTLDAFKHNAILNQIKYEKWFKVKARQNRGNYETVLDFSENYWGTNDLDLISKMVVSSEDDPSLYGADYDDFLTLNDDLASIYPFVTEAYLTNYEGIRLGEISNNQAIQLHIKFNRDMAQDSEHMPQVSYGPAAPYTDYVVYGDWISPREWVAPVSINPIINQGINYIRVKNAYAADDQWLCTGTDAGRFSFVVSSTSVESLMLQGSGGSNENYLNWFQDDYDVLAGYNIYRSTEYNVDIKPELQDFDKINLSIISNNEREYYDKNVEQGQEYYYYFTVVDTDFNESPASNVVKCTPSDDKSPVVISNAIGTVSVGTPISVSANVTDNVAVTQVNLYYKMKDDTSWQQAVMRNTVEDTYQAVIPSYSISEGTLEYYIVATDGTNLTYCGSEDYPNVVSVVGIVNVESVSLSDVEVEMIVGETYIISSEIYPDDATNKEVAWHSSDENVVSVENGLLVGVGVGEATVTVSTADGQYSAICNIKVNPILVSNLDISDNAIELYVGDQFEIDTTVYPANATDMSLSFVSSDVNVATVDDSGNVVAVGVGETDIIVSTNDDSDIEKICHLNVRPIVVQSVALNCISKTIEINDSFELTAIVYPSNSTDKTVKWETSDNSIVSVNNGTVTANAIGKATITVITNDGEKKAICNIEVVHLTGHTVVIDEAVLPDCTHTGLTEGSHCKVCGEVIDAQEVIPALGHCEVIIPAVEPSCTVTGLTAGTKCSVCDKVIVPQEMVSAKGHAIIVDNAILPSCECDGLTAGCHCDACGLIIVPQETIKANGHTEEVLDAVKPTCTNSGLTEGKYCSTCGEVLVSQEVIPALGHKVVMDEAILPTCEEEGLSVGCHCSDCGEILVSQEIVASTGHKEVNISEVSATCTENGVSAGVKCLVCGKIISGCEVIEASGHKIEKDSAVVPDDTHTGLTEGSHCSVCGKIIVPQNIVPTTAPTNNPTVVPTTKPINTPTANPTTKPTLAPTGIPTPTGMPTIEDDSKLEIMSFISRLYEFVLNRKAEQGGLDYWTEELYSFRQSGAEVAQGFIFSDEFIGRRTTNEEFVTILYKTFFGREPDAVGFNYWVETLNNGSNDRFAVANGFIYSQEWANTCAEYGIRSGGTTKPSVTINPTDSTYSFVERMYTTAMNRQSDPDGKKYWSTELANFKCTGESVGVSFFLSEEMVSLNLSDEEFVTRLYRTFMDREPEKDGYNYWVKFLKNGNSRKDAVYGFTRSEEFVEKCIEARILPN